MDEDRKRLEKTLTPRQLEQYDELKARIKRELTDAISAGLGDTLSRFGVEDADRRDFDGGFRDAVATGGASADFEAAMEEEDDGEEGHHG